MRQNSDETSSNLGSSQRLCQGYKDARYSTTDANVGHCYERPVNKGCVNMVNVRDNAFSALSFIIDSFSLSYLLTFVLFHFIFFFCRIVHAAGLYRLQEIGLDIIGECFKILGLTFSMNPPTHQSFHRCNSHK